MDHNGVFTADDGIDVVHRNGDRSRAGANGMMVAEGGVDKRNGYTHVEESEETPLLESGSSDDDSDYAPPEGSAWTAGLEWEGLPWYKTPSVRLRSSDILRNPN